jgi:hypothetical protein
MKFPYFADDDRTFLASAYETEGEGYDLKSGVKSVNVGWSRGSILGDYWSVF